MTSPYKTAEYRRARSRLLAGRPTCWVEGCDRPATVADHQPPLLAHHHLGEGRGCCVLLPQCAVHSSRQGSEVRDGIRRPAPWDPLEPVADPAGFPPESDVWAVPWLERLRDVPPDAVWPRLMTPPHPAAVDSLGARFAAAAGEREGRPLRWWQQLTAARLLEVDADGVLVWSTGLLTMARQLGKSWLLRELLWWRLHEGSRLGEPQTILHTGKDLSVCKEVQRPARLYAKFDTDRYKVREVNGQEEIELLRDGSRWMIRSRTAVYGISANLAAVDEAWKVATEVVDDGVIPTMVERTEPQLVLVSTAHRKATSLMLNRRRLALGALDDPGAADLLIEWSAPRDAPLDDPATWRLASPYWTIQRERVVAGALEAALTGEVDDVDEPDPIEAFRSQWLNQWPTQVANRGKGEPLLDDPGAWMRATTDRDGVGSAVLAVEDWFGKGAAVAVARPVEAGGWIVAGWEHPRRSDAFAQLAVLADRIAGSTLVVGATLADSPDLVDLPVYQIVAATGAQTRAGLALLRDLVDAGRIWHDPADGDQLDDQVLTARVQPLQTGLSLVGGTRADLLRALAWSITVAAAPQPVAAII